MKRETVNRPTGIGVGIWRPVAVEIWQHVKTTREFTAMLELCIGGEAIDAGVQVFVNALARLFRFGKCFGIACVSRDDEVHQRAGSALAAFIQPEAWYHGTEIGSPDSRDESRLLADHHMTG